MRFYYSVVVYFYEDGYQIPDIDARGCYSEYNFAYDTYKYVIDLYLKECKFPFKVVLSKSNGELVETLEEFIKEVK